MNIKTNNHRENSQDFIRYLSRVLLIAVCILASACAHRINITPTVSQLDAVKLPRIKKSVGYYISPESLGKQVVTPAGGGDKVKYLPYKESEPILKAILSNVFVNVYQLSSLNDAHFISSRNIDYIFIPEIKTNSSSRSIWIWPPSDFFVTLDCKAIKPSGEKIWKTTVNSEAHVGLPQVHRDFSLAGKVAVAKAFSELQQEIHVKFYDESSEEYYSPQNAVDSFDEGKDEYSSPQDQQEPKDLIEKKGIVDSFDDGGEYYSPNP